MQLIIPQLITQHKAEIEAIRLDFFGTDNKFLGYSELPKRAVDYPKQTFIITIDDVLYEGAILIRISVTTPSGNIWTINYDQTSKLQLVYAPPTAPQSTIAQIDNVKKNHDTIYNNTSADKQSIHDLLQQLHQRALQQTDAPIGSKNLIYYVIGHQDHYIRLLQYSLTTIYKHSAKCFDVVVITDETTKTKIIDNDILRSLIDDFVEVAPLKDGVACSILKTLIFNYQNINSYNKVLFLDCDIICKKDVSSIFALDLQPDKFYSVSNPTINTGSFKTLYHGLMAFDQQTIEDMIASGQLPFNAGQFMFVNSDRMRSYFDNINWLIDVWPDRYFFEQSFMNHYLCGNLITSPQLLSKHFDLLACSEDITQVERRHRDQTTFIHFVAPALRGDVKLAFIDAYTNANLL